MNTMDFDFDKKMTEDAYLEGRGGRLVPCIKCGKEGSLVLRSTKTKGKSYRYYCIEHSIGKKKTWCYLGKFENLPIEYKNILGAGT
jgi:hypothetical protein